MRRPVTSRGWTTWHSSVRMDISSEAEVATAIDTILAYARLTQGVAKSDSERVHARVRHRPERDRPDRVEGRAREETSDPLRGWRLRSPDDADAEMDGRSGVRSGDHEPDGVADPCERCVADTTGTFARRCQRGSRGHEYSLGRQMPSAAGVLA